MNSLSPSQPLLVVAIGHPGAGKSFFARQFSDMFGAPLVSYDEIRAELFNDMSYSSDEDAIVNRITGIQLRELVKTKRTVIVDGGHNPKVNRIALDKTAREAGYSTLYVWVQTDERTAKARSLRRQPSNPDDMNNRSLTTEEFTAHAKKFTAPNDRERFVVISGRHTFASQAKTVLKKLATPHKSDQPVTAPERRPAAREGRRVISL